MANPIIEAIREKEKSIFHTVDGVKYIVKDVGQMMRVTSVLGVVNFDNGFLKIWREKKAKEFFAKSIPASGTVNAAEAHKAFEAALKAGDNFAFASARFGTKVHGWLEYFALTGQFPVLEEDSYSDVGKVYQSVIKFVNDFGLGTKDIEIVKPELFLYHSLGFAGTADLVVLRKGIPYLIDYKVTNSLKFQYLLQLSAYTAALKELYNLDIKKATLIRFDKQGNGYEHVSLTNEELKEYFKLFKMCLLFYKAIQNPEHKSVKELYTPEHFKHITAGLL